MHDDDIHHFTDKLGRTIDIAGDSPGVVARHKGKQVGSFVIKEFDDDVGTPAFLEVVEVDPAYQNTGIGTAMLRLAHEYYGVNGGAGRERRDLRQSNHDRRLALDHGRGSESLAH